MLLVFADHKRRLVLLGTLFGIASGLLGCYNLTIALKAAHTLAIGDTPLGLWWLLLLLLNIVCAPWCNHGARGVVRIGLRTPCAYVTRIYCVLVPSLATGAGWLLYLDLLRYDITIEREQLSTFVPYTI